MLIKHRWPPKFSFSAAWLRTLALPLIMLGMFGGLNPSNASPQKSTFSFEWCERAFGQTSPKINLIEPDDFIAVCGGGGAPDTDVFKRNWQIVTERCKKGMYPRINEPAYARGSLTIKGEKVELAVSCEKVFDIASKYGVMSEDAAKTYKESSALAAKAAVERFKKTAEDSAAGVWQAQFALALQYLLLEDAPVAVYGKYGAGLGLVERLAKSGHGDIVLNYIIPYEAKARSERNVDKVYSAYKIQKSLADGGHSASAMRVCEIEVVQAKLKLENPIPDYPVPGYSDAEIIQTVDTACERAAELGTPAVKQAASQLKLRVSEAIQSSNARLAESRRAQQEAVLNLLSALVTASSTASGDQNSAAQAAEDQRNKDHENCVQQRDMIYSYYDPEELGFANAFMACP